MGRLPTCVKEAGCRHFRGVIVAAEPDCSFFDVCGVVGNILSWKTGYPCPRMGADLNASHPVSQMGIRDWKILSRVILATAKIRRVTGITTNYSIAFPDKFMGHHNVILICDRTLSTFVSMALPIVSTSSTKRFISCFFTSADSGFIYLFCCLKSTRSQI